MWSYEQLLWRLNPNIYEAFSSSLVSWFSLFFRNYPYPSRKYPSIHTYPQCEFRWWLFWSLAQLFANRSLICGCATFCVRKSIQRHRHLTTAPTPFLHLSELLDSLWYQTENVVFKRIYKSCFADLFTDHQNSICSTCTAGMSSGMFRISHYLFFFCSVFKAFPNYYIFV